MYFFTKTTTIFVLLFYLQSTVLRTISAIEGNEIVDIDSETLATKSNNNYNNKYLSVIVNSRKADRDNVERYNHSESGNRNDSDILNNNVFINVLSKDDNSNNNNYNLYEVIHVSKEPPVTKENSESSDFTLPTMDEMHNWKNKTEQQQQQSYQNATNILQESFMNKRIIEPGAITITNDGSSEVLKNGKGRICRGGRAQGERNKENQKGLDYNLRPNDNRFNINFDFEHILMDFQSDHRDSCLLDVIKPLFTWWSLPNGTLTLQTDGSARDKFLDLSGRNYYDESKIYLRALSYKSLRNSEIVAFSAAYNKLMRVPYGTLTIMKDTLMYLTLKGNLFNAPNPNGNFHKHYNGKCTLPPRNLQQRKQAKRERIGWATFPHLPELLELDISDCCIEFVTKEAFRDLPNLERLLLAHNRLVKIPADTFLHVPSITYLDLSFTNAPGFNISFATLEAAFSSIYGFQIPKTTFTNLPNLKYLDLSHTMLMRSSALAFKLLPKGLKYLSLCYSAFPVTGSSVFNNSALVALDLSGNPYVSFHITEDTFKDISDSLRYLLLENSNIKDLNWLQSLPNLQKLGLRGNNINSLSPDVFQALSQLMLLDLNSNQVGNWYKRVFAHNQHLRVLRLRNNNINIITTEMLKDLQRLKYLDIGDNDFVCDCLLSDLVETATANYKVAECVIEMNKYVNTENPRLQKALDIFRQAAMITSVPTGIPSYVNRTLHFGHNQLHAASTSMSYYDPEMTAYSKCLELAAQVPTYEKLNSSRLKLQLLDYGDEHYWCFNESERLQFGQLNCQRRNYVSNIRRHLDSLITCILSGVGGLIGLTLLCVFIYLNRWHIHYYYSSLKSAALVSVATKETVDKFNELSETNPNMVYDIFVSYCQNDRQWVLEELLPNVEVIGDITICMHERDFQIGLTILDNIISCMDRSKALMLIISTDFLLSHWCQFEMHLAQHRMFEASKEHLIIVFLEDISRSKRPKTLQYLMDVKTYIKWPSAKADKQVKSEDKKLFWKRMRRSLENIGIQLRK